VDTRIRTKQKINERPSQRRGRSLDVSPANETKKKNRYAIASAEILHDGILNALPGVTPVECNKNIFANNWVQNGVFASVIFPDTRPDWDNCNTTKCKMTNKMR
jgi:hypothetical protein